MNVAGVNSSPLLSGASLPEGVPALIGNAVPEGFTGTLIEQIALLSAAISQSELPQQLQSFAQSKVTSPVNAKAGVLENTANLQELAALLGKELPLSYKINEEASLQANQVALTDVLKYMTAGGLTEGAAAGKNVDETIIMDVPAQISPDQAGNGLSTERMENKSEHQPEDTENYNREAVLSILKPEHQPEEIEDPGIISELLMPWILAEGKSAGKKVDDSSAKEAVIKEKAVLTFLKPLVADSKLNSLEIDKPLDMFLPKAAAFNVSAQDNQEGIDLNSFEKKVLIERLTPALAVDKLVTDKTAPQQILDMAQLDRQLVSRPDVPAITKPLAHPDWSKELGDRIIWMNNKAIPAAEIKLNPQHLGPISVRIDINQDQATVTFSAQHGAVREALEASIPRLREMMSAQQLNLVDVNISQYSTDQGRSSSQGFAQTAGDSRTGQENTSMAAEGVSEAGEDIENGPAVVSKGLLSLYA
jgi:flagellar hook-length control protein FliK